MKQMWQKMVFQLLLRLYLNGCVEDGEVDISITCRFLFIDMTYQNNKN